MNLLPAAPASVQETQTVLDNDHIHLFLEKRAVTLTSALAVNALDPGLYTTGGNPTLFLPAGTQLDCYYFHRDRDGGAGSQEIEGTVTFPEDVIALIWSDGKLDGSDAVLANAPGTQYPPHSSDYRGLEGNPNDVVELELDGSGNPRRLRVVTRTVSHVDQLRVLTAPRSGAIAPYCFGDGVQGPCPCGNDAAAGSGSGCRNSTGAGATLAASGSPSLAAGDLSLLMTGLPASTFAIVYLGGEQARVPFGDGLRCVEPGPPGGNVLRLPVRVASAGTITYSGVVPLLQSAPYAGLVTLAPSWVWNFQGYYRNPLMACTGAGFNFTNALSVRFE